MTHPADAGRGRVGVGDQCRPCPNGTPGCSGLDNVAGTLPCADCFFGGDGDV